MSTQARGAAAGRRRLLALVLTIASVAAVIVASTAFAADAPPITSCVGKTLGKKGSSTELTYSFRCSQEIASYTIVADRSVAGFEVSSLGYKPSGALAPDDQFGCVGEIPGDGFSCGGTAEAHHTIKGDYETDTRACGTSKTGRLRSWLVVSSKTGVAAGPFAIARQANCKYAKHKKKKKKKKKATKKSSASKRSSH